MPQLPRPTDAPERAFCAITATGAETPLQRDSEHKQLSSGPLIRRLTNGRVRNNGDDSQPRNSAPSGPLIRRLTNGRVRNNGDDSQPRNSALKQLFCGGMAGCVAKSVTAPLSRLTILYQVHPMVTTKENRPKFSMTVRGGLAKIVERGGVLSLWKVSLLR